MSDDATYEELLTRWDRARARGEDVTVEDLCAGRPEMLGVLRLALESRGAVEASGESNTAGSSSDRPTEPSGAPLTRWGDDNATEDLTRFLGPALGPEEIGRLGHFRVVKLLGAGGMGAVFKAVDEQLGRSVAIKTLRPLLAASAVARRRFLREARSAAALAHDHVVTIYHVGEEQGIPFLVMPFLHGEALDERLRVAGRLPIGEVLRVAREAAEGLSAAHEQGLVHRDVKPANIWLESPRGRVKLLDFGLARTADEGDARLTQTGAIMGTPAYMPPEQALGEPVDHRGDLYSLGAVAYRMATGRAPFEARSVTATLAAVIRDEPPSPTSLAPDLPPALSDLIVRLLAKDPSARPGSARDVVGAIEAIERDLAAGPARPPTTPPPERSTTPAAAPTPGPLGSRRRWVAAIVALAVVTCGALALPQIIVRIRNKDGSVAELKVPPGAKVEVEHEGGVITVPPPRPPSMPAPTAPASPPRATGSAAWAPGSPEGSLPGLFPRQAWLPGMGRWQVETVAPRWGSSSLAWSSRGQIAYGDRGTIRVYDGATLALTRLIPHGPGITCTAWDPAGADLAVASHDAVVHIRKADGSSVELRGHEDGCFAVAWSPDGRRLASASQDGTVRVWRADGTPGPVLRGHQGSVAAVAWSPDGERLASGGIDQTVRVWRADGTAGTVLRGHTGPVRALAWHPKDGRLASAGDDKEIRTWAADGQAGSAFRGHEASIVALAWSPDGARLVSGSPDGSMRIWGADGTAGPLMVAHWGAVGVAWSPDGRRVAASGGGALIQIWEADGTAAVTLWGQSASMGGALSWDGDGTRLAVTRRVPEPPGPGIVVLGADGRPGVVVHGPGGRSILGAAWSPSGSRLAASGTWDGGAAGVALLHPDGQVDRILPGSQGDPSDLAWDPAGRRLAVTYAKSKEVRIWEADGTAGPVLVAGASLATSAWSPDGKRLAAGGEGGKISTWWADGTAGPILEGHDGRVLALAWRPGGEGLASGGSDGTIRLWPGGERPGRVIRPGGGEVRSLSWEPGGTRLASVDDTGVVRLWSAAGEPLRALRDHDRVAESVAWSPRGGRIVSRDYAAKVVAWDAATGEPTWTAVPLSDGPTAVFSPAGELIHGDPGRVDKELVFTVEGERGELELLTRTAFLERAAEARAAAERASSGDAVDFAAERRAAEWLLGQLGRGANLFDLADAEGRPFARFDKQRNSGLPETPFVVDRIELGDDSATPAGMWRLAGCRRIREASVNGLRATSSRHLQPLRGCRSLRSLWLSWSQAGDALAAMLADWPELRDLSLLGCVSVGDPTARAWPDCPRLRTLYLSGTGVGDEGLAQIVRRCPGLDEIHIERHYEAGLPRRVATLRPLRALHHVGFGGDQLGDDGLAVLRDLPRLDRVSVESPLSDQTLRELEALGGKLIALVLTGWGPRPDPITDAGFAAVARMRGLRELAFFGGRVAPTDAALAELARMPDLGKLTIEVAEPDRRHTAAGVAAFRAKRPDVALTVDGRVYPANAP